MYHKLKLIGTVKKPLLVTFTQHMQKY